MKDKLEINQNCEIIFQIENVNDFERTIGPVRPSSIPSSSIRISMTMEHTRKKNN